MTSLPHEVPRFRDNTYVIAYNMCLRLEKSLQEAANDGQNVEKELIYIRVLGFLLHHVPTDFGLKTIVYEISSTAGDSILLLQVGKMYFDHYIKACTFTPLSFNVPSDLPAVTQLKLIRVEHHCPPVLLLVPRSTRMRQI